MLDDDDEEEDLDFNEEEDEDEEEDEEDEEGDEEGEGEDDEGDDEDGEEEEEGDVDERSRLIRQSTDLTSSHPKKKQKARKLFQRIEDEPLFEWHHGGLQLLKVKRALLPLPFEGEKSKRPIFLKELSEKPFLRPALIVEANNLDGAIELSVSKKIDGERLWSDKFVEDEATTFLARPPVILLSLVVFY